MHNSQSINFNHESSNCSVPVKIDILQSFKHSIRSQTVSTLMHESRDWCVPVIEDLEEVLVGQEKAGVG